MALDDDAVALQESRISLQQLPNASAALSIINRIFFCICANSCETARISNPVTVSPPWEAFFNYLAISRIDPAFFLRLSLHLTQPGCAMQ